MLDRIDEEGLPFAAPTTYAWQDQQSLGATYVRVRSGRHGWHGESLSADGTHWSLSGIPFENVASSCEAFRTPSVYQLMQAERMALFLMPS